MMQQELASHFILETKAFSSHSYANTTFNKYVVHRVLGKNGSKTAYIKSGWHFRYEEIHRLYSLCGTMIQSTMLEKAEQGVLQQLTSCPNTTEKQIVGLN